MTVRHRARSSSPLVILVASVIAMGTSLAILVQPAAAEEDSATWRREELLVHSSIGPGERDGLSATWSITYFLPFIGTGSCPSTGQSYATTVVTAWPKDPPAEQHPDLNLAIRGFVPTTATLGLVDYGGATDHSAPQLSTLFPGNHPVNIGSAFQVYDWDWANSRRGTLIDSWPVTLLGLKGTPGEIVRTPNSGYDMGWTPDGYQAVVLFASSTQLTLNYTREGSAAFGYTVHVENICVDPALLELYQTTNAAGRSRLPALFAGQTVGRLTTGEIQVAVRDTGSFMDPRSRKDWWQGK